MNPASGAEEPPVPGLDPVAAARWHRLPRSESPWLNETVAERMAERLDWIRREPGQWLHWAPVNGGLEAHRRLVARFPGAKVAIEGEPVDQALRHGSRPPGPVWTPLRWLGRAAQALRQDDTSPAGPVDMLWANMALHLAPRPRGLLARWRDALAVDGFLMFSCLGPDTLRELRAVYDRLGWPAPTHAYTDMHDWGDMLVEVGFAEPVMDMERLTLTYPDAPRLLQDLRQWGRNLHQDRFPACRGRAWRERLCQALEQGLPRNGAGQLLLTIEVVYGHAFKALPRMPLQASSAIAEQDMRAMLRRGRQQ